MKKLLLGLFFIVYLLSFSKTIVLSEMREVDGELIIVLIGYQMEYMVKKGDTLESIAKEFNMSIEELKKRNHLESDKDLKVDQVIMVDVKKEKDEKNSISVKYDF